MFDKIETPRNSQEVMKANMAGKQIPAVPPLPINKLNEGACSRYMMSRESPHAPESRMRVFFADARRV